MNMRDILKHKGSDVLTADIDTSVIELAYILQERNIGALLVEDGGRLCGIVTERDVVRIVAKTGGDLEGVRAGDIMVKSENLVVAEADDLNEQVMAVMVEKNFRHMPVVEEGEIVGLISIRDVIRAHVITLQSKMHFLSEYLG